MNVIKYIVNLWICAVILPITSHSLYGNQSDGDFATSRITAQDGELYAWLHKGILFYRSDGLEKKGEYLYCGKDGYLVVVSTLPRFSAMIQEELGDRQSASSFVRLKLSYVIFSFFGPKHAEIVDKGYVKYREGLPLYVGRGASKADMDLSLEILEKYDDMKTTIEDNDWRSEFCALLENGSIEKWNIDGKISPFSVDHLTRMIVEKEATIIPLQESDGNNKK